MKNLRYLDASTNDVNYVGQGRLRQPETWFSLVLGRRHGAHIEAQCSKCRQNLMRRGPCFIVVLSASRPPDVHGTKYSSLVVYKWRSNVALLKEQPTFHTGSFVFVVKYSVQIIDTYG